MVKDIVTTAHNVAPSWPFFPGPMVEMDGIFYFRGTDGIHGVELFRTDLTAAGTWMVKDICKGRCNGAPLIGPPMLVHDGHLYFAADDADHGLELWRSDGSAAGTTLVADLVPGFHGSYPGSLTALGAWILFAARSGNAYGLWRSDGSPAGTELVKASWDVSPRIEGVLGSSAIFLAQTQDEGTELWVSDGTEAGTVLLRDIAPGPVSGISYSGSFTNVPRTMYFAASQLFFSATSDGTHFTLWKSDGTTAGTEPVDESAPVPADPDSFAELDGLLYFSAWEPSTGRELWRTDGTEGGTDVAVDADLGVGWTDPKDLIPLGANLFYSAVSAAAGRELWISDGTPGSTHMVKDIAPGQQGFGDFTSRFSVVSQNTLFFPANDGVHGQELWVSDGTENGTHIVRDVFPGASDGVPVSASLNSPIPTGDGVLTFALDPIIGWAPWRSDGTAQGTQPIADLDLQASSLSPYAVLSAAGPAGSAFFSPDDGVHGMEPWVSDATAEGTQILADIRPNPPNFDSPLGFVNAGLYALFAVPSAPPGLPESELWGSDGTPQGTLSLTSFGGLFPAGSSSANGLGLFEVENGNGEGPLYRSDGTPSGTFILEQKVDRALASDGERLYFSKLSDFPDQIWTTDGTLGGEQSFAVLPTGALPFIMGVAGDQLFFAADDAVAGYELWRSDGSDTGTLLLKDIRPGQASFISASDWPNVFTNEFIGFYPEWLSGGQRFFFLANDGSHGRELWISDGTSDGTLLLNDIAAGPTSSDIHWLTLAGNNAFFAADDGLTGRELWVSDGTPQGTHLAADIVAGPGSSMPQSIIGVDGTAYFSAWTPATGLELWRSDGTPAQTALVGDLNPGPDSSSPSGLIVSGPYLFFQANDGVHGFELWAKTIPSRALAASSLQIDDALSNANGLWELGETVKLRPVWENLSISNITAVTAAASGTNGAQTTDSAASYGTFAPLDLRSCLSTGNCYAADLAGPRPSPHWDVTLHETLSTGKVFDWPIHIAGSFDDVMLSDPLYADAEALLHAGLTAGCAPGTFCAEGVVTRAQAALFLSLGLAKGNAGAIAVSGAVPSKGAYDCSPGGASVFTDVDPEDPFCRAIHDVAAREITLGCASDRYCPDDPISRAQLALLLGKTLAQGAIPIAFSGAGGSYDCSLGTPDVHFLDVDENHPFCAAAHYLWATQISAGCNGTHFCPDGLVTRAQAARFLVEAFALQLP